MDYVAYAVLLVTVAVLGVRGVFGIAPTLADAGQALLGVLVAPILAVALKLNRRKYANPNKG